MEVGGVAGEPVDPSLFEHFEVTKVLAGYIRPSLFLASGTSRNDWAFSSRRGGPEGLPGPDAKELPEIWIAFPITPRRRSQLLREHVSLREAIRLSESRPVESSGRAGERLGIVVAEGENPLRPKKAVSVSSRSLPPELLPLKDVSVYGKVLPGSRFTEKSRNWQLRLHFIEGSRSQATSPLAVTTSLQEGAQRYLTWAAHYTFDSRAGRRETEPVSVTEVGDWSGIVEPRVTPGTLTVKGRSRTGEPEKVAALARACEALSEMFEGSGSQASPSKAYDLVGVDALASLRTLLLQLWYLGLALNLSWKSPGEPNQTVIIDPEQAKTWGESLDDFVRKQGRPLAETRAVVTVDLSVESAAALQKEVNGSGGMQDLLRDLMKQFQSPTKLSLYPDQVSRIVHYVQDYGQGGFQERLKPVYWALHRLGFAFSGIR